MSLKENIAWGEKAVMFVKSKVGYGMSSNNQKAHVIQSLGGIEGMIKDKIYNNVMKMVSPIDEKKMKVDALADKIYLQKNASIGYAGDNQTTLYFRAKALAAIQEKTGNCMEQAAIAYFWLKTQGVSPIDYVFFTNGNGGYDHAWVLIGRPDNKLLEYISGWGETDTVWCDPWQMQNGMVYSINDLLKKKVVNLDANYKLDSIENVQKGVPESLMRD
jgi:hypothetical protein